MPNLTPVSSFDEVPELEITTLALGGPGGPMNLPAQALLNRTQWLKDNAVASTAGPYAAGSGTANAITATFTPPITSMADGLKLRILAAATNTGAATFAPDALTAQPIVGGAYASLQGGEILANGEVELTWNATLGAWVITAQAGGSPQVPDAAKSKQAASKGQVDQITTDLASSAEGKGAALIAWIAGGVGAVARWLLDKLRERPSVADYGADPTGAVSSVAAFNAALVANDNVFIPPGTYLIDDAVSIGLGKRLYGTGRRKTILHMPSTFNASALGALAFTGGADAGEISDLSIIQDQPDSVTPTAYPPCIYAQGAARFSLHRLRLPAVYVGIDMKGNAGGAVLDDIELSPLSIGIDIDGSLDTVKISKLHLWPFGGVGSGLLTANQRTAYDAAYGVKSARCDGLSISDSLFYEMANALYMYNSANGSTIAQMSNSGFDGDGGMKMLTTGSMQMVGGYFTNSSGAGNWLNMTGGDIVLSGVRLIANATFTGNGGIDASGGSLSLTGCYFKSGALDVTHVYASGATTVNIAGGIMVRAGSGSYVKPTIRYAGTSTGSVSGVYAPKRTSGTGVFVQIDADTGVNVSGNNALAWSMSTPSGALANTRVDGNLGTNKDTFSGYFSSDATTTVKLPTGWTVSRLGAGNYSVTHTLGLSSATDISVNANADNTTAGGFAVVSVSESTTAALRIRTYVGTTSTDEGVFFSVKRNRS